MKLKDILAIGGKPGLYKFIAQAKSGIIVESLSDKKRTPAYAHDKVSALEDIAIFTGEGEVKLGDVFKKIHEKENGGKSISHKSSGEELKAYFADILPDYDRERVYTSDMKKVFSWYNQLHELDMLVFDDEDEDVDKEDVEEEKEKGTVKSDTEDKSKEGGEEES